MALWSGALEATQNEDWSETWGFAYMPYEAGELPSPQNAVAYNFSGAVAVWTIAESQDEDAEVLLQLTSAAGQIVFGTETVDGIPYGTVTLALTAAQLRGLPAGEFFENLLVTLTTNDYYLMGPFIIQASVGW
jgi:hypothetical protein